ncbi:MAG: O-antigen ligase family protein [Candidatus Omnitrophica bacterium]|nr:O-antigen ligase family protein [Candidatus Omnitrophota bacterium]
MREIYVPFCRCLFFAYLLAMISFGRTFALQRIHLNGFPIFVTEILLFFCLPVILIGIRRLGRIGLPGFFITAVGLFFLLTGAHFIGALWHQHNYAFRDSILGLYILFVPLTVGLSENKSGNGWIYYIFAANIISLILGRIMVDFFIYGEKIYFFSNFIKPVIFSLKGSQVCLYYNFVCALLLFMIFLGKKGLSRFLCVLLLSMNLYMLYFMICRAAWLAAFILIIFCGFIFWKKENWRTWGTIAGLFILFIALFFSYDIYIRKINTSQFALAKINSFWYEDKIDSNFKNLPEPSCANPVTPQEKQEISNHFAAIVKMGSFASVSWRFDIYRRYIALGMESPIWGSGFGVYPNFTGLADMVINPDNIEGFFIQSLVTPAHNELVSLFAKVGLFGILLFLVINIYVWNEGLRLFRAALPQEKIILGACLGCILVWHVMALTFDIIDSPPTNYILWVLIGVILSKRGFIEKSAKEA